MAAITTRKPGGETAVQLTFPAVYQSVYASQHRPLQYAPSAPGPLVRPMAGDDFQSHYHAQKKADADYMARAKVVSTQNARKRMLLSHQNYFGMPNPQLAQREFANPSNGAGPMESARRDGGVNAPFQLVEAGLIGGVLRTAEGQAYGKARLVARIQQLDRIDAEKGQFIGAETGLAPSPAGVQTLPTAPTGAVSDNAKIELQLLLQSIIDALMGDTARNPGEKDDLSRITFADSVRALSLIIRVASSADTDAETLEDVKAPIDNINQLLDGLTDPDRIVSIERSPQAEQRLITTAELFQRIGDYIDQMMGAINRSPKDRIALSKNLVKSLGFTEFARDMERQRVESKGFYERVARTNLFDARGRQEMDDADDDRPDDDFDAPASRREDTEQGTVGTRAGFDEDERQVFGYASGSWYGAPAQQGREEPTYLGEERPSLEQLAAPERVLQPAISRQVSRATGPSTQIRAVYDPVLGARGVEVVRQGSRATTRTGAPAEASLVSPAESVAPPRSERTLPRRSPRRPRIPTESESTTASELRRRAALPRMPLAPAEIEEARREGRPAWLPRRREDLPTSRETLDLLAKQINAAGGLTESGQIAGFAADGKPKGKSIRVYSAGEIKNIRRNFIRRLGL